jgi:hypothetical protein
VDDRSLLLTFQHAVAESGQSFEPVSLAARLPNALSSSFPLEVATFRLASGDILRVLCKHDEGGTEEDLYTHRRGLEYEAKVYQALHQANLSAPIPHYYGFSRAHGTAAQTLFLEYCADGERSNRIAGAVVRAARLIGDLHRRCSARVPGADTTDWIRHDDRYFSQWLGLSEKIFGLASDLRHSLDESAERIARAAASSAAEERVLVHGEYYTSNVLIGVGAEWIVDWQSAATSFGEIDLASIISGKWPEPVVQAAIDAYASARWDGCPPDGFSRRLQVAQGYWACRWAVHFRDGSSPEFLEAHAREAVDIGEKLGLP